MARRRQQRAYDALAPLGGLPFDDRRDYYTNGTHSFDCGPDAPRCDDPDRRGEHPLGTASMTCRSCAIAVGPETLLLPDPLDDGRGLTC